MLSDQVHSNAQGLVCCSFVPRRDRWLQRNDSRFRTSVTVTWVDACVEYSDNCASPVELRMLLFGNEPSSACTQVSCRSAESVRLLGGGHRHTGNSHTRCEQYCDTFSLEETNGRAEQGVLRETWPLLFPPLAGRLRNGLSPSGYQSTERSMPLQDRAERDWLPTWHGTFLLVQDPQLLLRLRNSFSTSPGSPVSQFCECTTTTVAPDWNER